MIRCCTFVVLGWAMISATATVSASAAESGAIKFTWAPSLIAEHETAMTAIREKNSLAEPPLDRPLRVTLARTTARPQDRWLDARINIAPNIDLTATKVRTEVYAIGGREPIAVGESTPTRERGVIFIDVRAAGLTKGRLVVTLESAGNALDVVETFVAADAAPAIADGVRIPIELDAGSADPSQAAWVTFGVPFAPGTLWNADRLHLVDGAGRPLPHQSEITGHWAREGSVQWVRFDALAVTHDGCFVELAKDPIVAPPARLHVFTSPDGRVRINTGAAVYELMSDGPSPIHSISLGDTIAASAAGTRGLYVVDQQGTVASAGAAESTMLVESQGPEAACVRFEGDYRTADGRRLVRHITRLELFAGRVEAKIQHTLVITEDTNATWFTDVGWELAVDGGDGVEAVFAKDRDSQATITAPLDGTTSTAWVLQDAHYRFAHGENHFAAQTATADGKTSTLHEGEECGDWFAVAGKRGGLGWSCRDAARQHPKEFEAHRDRATLHLFSSRGGEQLDFRMPALVKKWDLAGWLEHTMPARQIKTVPDIVAKALKIEHTAIGWSKTHHLLIAPLAAKESAAAMQLLAAAHSRPVYARPAADWVYTSRALGVLHPRDEQNFADVEATIDAAVGFWQEKIRDWGEYGFVDYYVGPHLSYTGKYAEYKRYHWATYGLKAGLWHVFARGGDAETRELAERCTQGFMDSVVSHWEGAGRRKGMLLGSTKGGDLPGESSTLPLFWDAHLTYEMSGSTDLRQLTWSYQLTGNRRAKDVLVQYGDAVKRHWSPQEMQKSWRVLMAFRSIVQVYGLTWDAKLGDISAATLDVISDPVGELGLTKDRAYGSSTYKTQSDVAAIIEAAEILGLPRCEELVTQMSTYLWPRYWATTPITYNNPVGRLGHFRYERTGDASIPETLALQLRRVGGYYDRDEKAFQTEPTAPEMLFLMQGVPYAQHVVKQTGVWKEPTAAWAAADDLGQPVSYVVFKRRDDPLTLQFRLPTSGKELGTAGSEIDVRPVGTPNGWGLDLIQISADSGDNGVITLPKDAAEGAYEIRSTRSGPHYLMADRRTPLVVHAPGYWQPQPSQSPSPPWFFKVPADATDAAIFFEGSARVFRPDGEPLDGGRPQHGWVELPNAHAGLWSFEPVDDRLVRVRNLPPFFAVRSADHYFEPPVPWNRETPAANSTEKNEPFVAGAIGTAGNKALQISGKRRMTLLAGETKSDGDGGAFLPFRQGTIEFYYRPNRSSVDVEKTGSILTLETKTEPWSITQMHNPTASEWHQNHSLLATFVTEGLSSTRGVRCYRQTLLEKDRWVHVAWVWGVRHDLAVRGGRGVQDKAQKGILVNLLFIDGQRGRFAPDQVPGNVPAFEPMRLTTGAAFNGTIDELRISDVLRYTNNFEPPPRDREMIVDDKTRALFHFNGSLAGETSGDQAPQVEVE